MKFLYHLQAHVFISSNMVSIILDHTSIYFLFAANDVVIHGNGVQFAQEHALLQA